MKQISGMVIKLMNGEAVTFAKGDVRSFRLMPEGYLFVESPDIVKEEKLKKTAKISYLRTWIPTHTIKRVEMMTDTEFEDEVEYKKYKKFMEHGIDITRQQISHTEPDVDKIKAAVDAQVKKEKEGK